jgi:hypothetical protein
MSSAQTDAIPPQDRRHTVGPRGVLIACLVGALMLLLLCSRELPPWADREWAGLSDAAQAIDDTLSAAGFTAPYDAIHGLMQRLAGD